MLHRVVRELVKRVEEVQRARVRALLRERLLLASGVTKLVIPTPTIGDPLRPSKSCILKRFSTPYTKLFRRH